MKHLRNNVIVRYGRLAGGRIELTKLCVDGTKEASARVADEHGAVLVD